MEEKPQKVTLNTSVLSSTRNYIIAVAKKHDTTYSEALDLVVKKASSRLSPDESGADIANIQLAKLEEHVLALNTEVRYLAFKVSNLPCHIRE